MSAVVADTHSILWYLNNLPDLSPAALQAMETAEQSGVAIYVPSIVLVELRYLVEKGRDITESDFQTVITELMSPSSALTLAPLDQLTAETLAQIPRAHCAGHARPHHRGDGIGAWVTARHERHGNS